MATMDIFGGDAFTMVSLTDSLNKQDFQPMYLSSKGIFVPKRVRTETIAIEEKNGVLGVIQTSERGAPLAQKTTQKRKIRDFRTPRIAESDTIRASEIANIRAFGSETEFKQVQDEVSDRLNGPAGLMRQVELTWENMKLGAVQGIVLDADGSTIYDFFAEFGVTQATEIDFDLDAASPASGAVLKKCNQVTRQMKKAAKGAWVEGRTYAEALCGDDFWDNLISHSEVRATYLNTQQAQDLRNDVGAAYSSFRYGGINWINYRGTDDDSATVGIPAAKAKFYPVNAPGAFVEAFSPGEFFDTINLPGQDVYAMIIPDRDRNAFVNVEVYSYPLPICTRPLMLQRARYT